MKQMCFAVGRKCSPLLIAAYPGEETGNSSRMCSSPYVAIVYVVKLDSAETLQVRGGKCVGAVEHGGGDGSSCPTALRYGAVAMQLEYRAVDTV